MDNYRNIAEILKKYFSGESSKRGDQAFNKWFDSFDDSTGFLDELGEDERESHKKQLLNSLKENLEVGQDSGSTACLRDMVAGFKVIYKIAAVLILGVILTVAGLYITGDYEPTGSMIKKSNQIGEISTVTLPDGSKVWLGVASTLTYPNEFTGGNRSIYLNGEAFFDVARDTTRPFIVESGPVKALVLGTSFNIKAYKEDSDVEITLATGKLEVTAGEGSQKEVLAPGQQIKYEEGRGLGNVQKVDTSLVKAWTDQELVFIREPFAKIARTFERWYGVEFLFEDESLKEELFVYHFDELSLQKSLDILSRIAGFEYQINNNQVIIRAMSE